MRLAAAGLDRVIVSLDSLDDGAFRALSSDRDLEVALSSVWESRTDPYSELRSADTVELPKGRDVLHLHRRLNSTAEATIMFVLCGDRGDL